MANLTCQKCKKTMDEDNFYTYKSGEKTELCKKCLTMHIDNFNPETFLWLLEKMDVPYIEGEWNILRDRAYAKDPLKMNGMSVFGKYLSKMKLKQWRGFGWADTETMTQTAREKMEELAKVQLENEAELKRQYEAGEINEAQYKTLMSADTQYKEMTGPNAAITGLNNNNPYAESNFMDKSELPDLGAELTQDDKIALALKWGTEYTPTDWIQLEQKYNEMMKSFDIQDSDTIGTLILICKTYLKMNQAINDNDIETFQKLSRVYEPLRKSAKFTAAQNKQKDGDVIDSIGELVAMCEREGGFIPRFVTDIPQDKVDATLQDNNNYLYKLVTQDLGFGQQIEDALKKIQIQKEMNDADIKSEEEGEIPELEDSDFMEQYEEIEAQKALDDEAYDEEV